MSDKIVALIIQHPTGRKRTVTPDELVKLGARSNKWKVIERLTKMPGAPTKAELPVTTTKKEANPVFIGGPGRPKTTPTADAEQ